MYQKYNTIENHQYIPEQAFLYFPSGDSKKYQQDDFKAIHPNIGLRRLIYEGQIQYTDEENRNLVKFYSYLKNKHISLQKQWTKPLIYKFLQSTGFDYKKTVKQIFNHTEYQKQIRSKDFQALRKRVLPFLKQGIFYFNGRDSKFRPIIITNIAKIHELKISEQQLNECLQYFFQFLYRNCFINGQVQNVVGIIDVGFTSPFNLLKPMKMTINFLQGNYKYKMHAMYIIGTTSMFNMAYSVAKQFMKEDTIRKITIIDGTQRVDPLLQYCNPSQLQQKFGGTHPNLKNGEQWPPIQFSNNYSHPKVKTNIITQKQYRQLYKEGKLQGRKICRTLIIDDSQLETQLPIINSKPPTIRTIKHSQTRIESKHYQPSFIKRAFKRISCKTCFVHKQDDSIVRK